MANKFFTKSDLLLILIVFIMGSLPFILPAKSSGEMLDGIIEVQVEGNVIHRYTINYSNTSKIITFDFNHKNITYNAELETKDGKVRLLRLPEEIVPKSIHADMGWIADPHQIIVALPVKMTVRIKGKRNKEKHELDSIAY